MTLTFTTPTLLFAFAVALFRPNCRKLVNNIAKAKLTQILHATPCAVEPTEQTKTANKTTQQQVIDSLIDSFIEQEGRGSKQGSNGRGCTAEAGAAKEPTRRFQCRPFRPFASRSNTRFNARGRIRRGMRLLLYVSQSICASLLPFLHQASSPPRMLAALVPCTKGAIFFHCE